MGTKSGDFAQHLLRNKVFVLEKNLWSGIGLNTVYISSWNNFDHNQFQADVTSNYYDNLIAQRDQAYWDNYVPSGDYGPDKDFTHALMAGGVVGLPALAAEGGLALLGDYAYTQTVNSLSQITVSSAMRDIGLNTLSQWIANGGDINQVNWIEAGLSSIPGYGSTILGETIGFTTGEGFQMPKTFSQWLAGAGGGVISNYFGNATDNYLTGEGIAGELVGEYFKFLIETASNAAPKALE